MSATRMTLDGRLAAQAQKMAAAAQVLRSPGSSEIAQARMRRDLAAVEAELWQLAGEVRQLLALIAVAAQDGRDPDPPRGRAA